MKLRGVAGRGRGKTGGGGGRGRTAPHEARLMKEMTELSKLNLGDAAKIVWPDPDVITKMRVTISPEKHYWAGASYDFSIEVTSDYPHEPPKVHCDTKVRTAASRLSCVRRLGQLGVHVCLFAPLPVAAVRNLVARTLTPLLVVCASLPASCPSGQIYHPNIDLAGKVCLNILRADWRPIYDVAAVVNGLIFLFYDPNPNDPLNKGASYALALLL